MAEIIENGNATENSGAEKLFTQADIDRIVANRLERVTRDMPSKDELKAYNDWKANQQTEADKLKEAETARDTEKAARLAAEAKLEQYEREKYLTSKGVSADELEFYCFKIGQLVTDKTDFETAADSFIADRKPSTVKMDTGASLEGGKATMTKDQIMQIKDATERQEAIAKNIGLFMKG